MECEAFREDQMDVLYGEADAATARRVSEHHASCATCREEMASMRRMRRDLSAWTLPEGVARRPPVAPQPAGWLAVAAALVATLGAGLALSGSELRHEHGTLTLRIGQARADVQALLAEQETRHRAEMEALRRSLVPAAVDGTRRTGSDEALLSRMAQMVRESEARQDARVGARLAVLSEQAETQRRYDLARVSAGLSYLDGKTGQDVVRTTELMGYVLQASQQK
jgi:hypothetical protein